MLQKDFDKEFLEIFLKYSLECLFKKVLITDCQSAYSTIIEKICIIHQLCIFHIIKNKRTTSFRKIRKLEKRIETITNTIKDNEEKIEELNKYRGGKQGLPRKNTNAENKKLRKQLKEQKDIDERISNIYNINSQKDANRRFNTIHNQINKFNEYT